jgi:hypothetical protein
VATTPDFVVVGHVVRDLLADGWRLGGTAGFAAAQARKLGLDVGVVTRIGEDLALDELLPGVALAGRTARTTTTFENLYDGTRRRQRVPVQAEPLDESDVPAAWRSAPMALVGPVCGEVRFGPGDVFRGPHVGLAAQGWLRRLDREGRVRRRAWSGPPFWSGCGMLFVSDEDLGRRRDQLGRWAAEVPIVAVTRERHGARVHDARGWRVIDAVPVRELDPTGAGDIFATAFMVRYHETGDVAQSTRFATAAAAWSVEAAGIEGVADRKEIEARMEEHPEVVLR